MYVCICNAFTDKDVEQALSDGARSIPDVFRALDCSPNCGSCLTHMRNMIRQKVEAEPTDFSQIAAE